MTNYSSQNFKTGDGKEEESLEEGISIGALSRATGISIHSLRMWERRYGSPNSLRRPSGHRRYPYSEVARLRAVSRALAAGYRAGEVVQSSIADIDRLLEHGSKGARPTGVESSGFESNAKQIAKVESWIELTKNYHEAQLSAEFTEEWIALGPLHFMLDRSVPFVKRLGEAWQLGQITVANEHFASELLDDFLVSRWRSLNLRASGRPFIMGTLSRDLHRLGLQMAAVITAMAGKRILFLGAGVPVDDLATVCRRSNAEALCLGISNSVAMRFSNSNLDRLRALLPRETKIICGGMGAPAERTDVLTFKDLASYYEWFREQRES